MKNIWINETKNFISQEVILYGWVHNIREHGKLIFIDLRDRSGVIQCVFTNQILKDSFDLAQQIRPEYVLEIKGKIQQRAPHLINPHIETGEIEILVNSFKILSTAKTLPFGIDDDGYTIQEHLRLRYRYLDLRRKRMQKNIINRHRLILFLRNWLASKNFVEVETPILTKSTPEGARDYLVPSRLEPGKFYALPQSPQQYKQLLMVSGIERYFQIARCFRDEDTRGDRQPEFTQLDIEMSFVNRDDVMNLIEKMIYETIKELYPHKKIKEYPFPRLQYQEVIKKFGSDRPDLRKDKKDSNELAFAFIIDFPMFEWKETENRWDTMHHPFTQPKLKNSSTNEDEIIGALKTQPETLLSEQYDIVLNGYEIGGGSIRIINPKILIEVFKVLGHNENEIQQKFGHLLEAFSYGVPPHGGIALGLDRFLMILENEPSIREVIAFPKTGEGRDLMMSSPSEVSKEQLNELNLEIKIKDE